MALTIIPIFTRISRGVVLIINKILSWIKKYDAPILSQWRKTGGIINQQLIYISIPMLLFPDLLRQKKLTILKEIEHHKDDDKGINEYLGEREKKFGDIINKKSAEALYRAF